MNQRWSAMHSVGLLIILLFVLVVGLETLSSSLAANWLLILVLLTAFTVIVGHGIVGEPLGFLIDERNKLSLSRFQMIAWTLLVVSAFVAAALANVAGKVDDPLSIALPDELWLLMGISTTSLVGSPLILSTKKTKAPDPVERNRTIRLLAAETGREPAEMTHQGQVLVNESPRSARLSDLFRGDETGNGAQLDLGKIQMFYFTWILLIAYGAALARVFDANTVSEFPAISDGMVALLAVSHAGYLGNKLVPHSVTDFDHTDAPPPN